MNLARINILHEVASEVKAQGGLAQFKAHALKNLELRTVLKESHASPILDLVFNSLNPEHHNLFASIGKDQVTIYDDEHMGDYLGVVVHYVNSASAHHQGGDVTCCAWVQTAGISRHELGDACLAVSGPEGVIQVISVAEARVVALLKGHRGEVLELRGCAGVPGLLLSLGADGRLRLWDVAAGACLAEVDSQDATTAELHPDGSCLFTGHRGGRVYRWPLDLLPPPTASPSPTTAAAAPPLPSSSSSASASCFVASSSRPLALRDGWASASAAARALLPLPGSPALGDHVDCIRCLPAGRLAAKSSDGRLGVWELGTSASEGASASGGGSGSGGGGGGEGGVDGGAEGAVAAAGEPRQMLSLRVPGTHPAGGGGSGTRGGGGGGRCRFSVTCDGSFLCIGNSAGDVYVYDAVSGGRTAHHSAHKVGGPALAAGLSEDGRHLLVVRGNGYILRYEYIRKQLEPAAAEAEAGVDAGVTDVAASSRDVSPETPLGLLPAADEEGIAVAEVLVGGQAEGAAAKRSRQEGEELGAGREGEGGGDGSRRVRGRVAEGGAAGAASPGDDREVSPDTM